MTTRPFADDALNLITALLDAPERAVELVRSLVAHPSAEVRMRALEALIDVERPETVTIAAQALSDPDATVRVAAIEVLTAQGREEHTQTIWRLAVSDPDPHVREQALLNLSALNGPLDVDELVELAKNTTGAHQVAAANLLCARGHREWLLPLLEGLYDPDYLTRAMTLTVLEDRIESQERPFVRRLLVERHTAEDLPAVRALIETLVGEWSEG
ncbi:MAG: HEAT repeat domain-containing protein [Deltaproteobacteria bacterium]|nr:HEAT repeat domain-containing protein [Deltaproteobacteria bacterium]